MGMATAVLMAFFFFLLIKWNYVRRPFFYLIGVAGLAGMMLFDGIFGSINRTWAMTINGIVTMLCQLVAFAAALIACYGAELPVKVPGDKPKGESKPAQAAQQAPPPPPHEGESQGE